MIRIPISKPSLTSLEESYVSQAVKSSWISSKGPFIDRFESSFAELCGAKYAAAVSNGTSALHVALMALDVRPGDEVLVPSLTYIATANAVRYVGAEPVFVDVDPLTWCIDPKLLEASITRRTKGIIAVHLYGHPADMDAINRCAAIHGLWVVEDAAEAHFASYKGRPTGGLARLGVFSFYGNKILTSGEGGAVVSNDSQLDLRVRTLKGQGVDPSRQYFFPVTGYNFRMTNIQAAILCAQLERATTILEGRLRVYRRYTENLSDIPWIELQPKSTYVTLAPWMFCMTVNRVGGRDRVRNELERAGVETRPFFLPLHKLPPFREASKARGEVLPNTDAISSIGINLPTYPDLTDSEIDEICDLIKSL